MSRADLGSLTPSVSVTATTLNAVVNNPLLDPIRAKTADLGLEWYFSEGSLLSAAVFYKDIETYIQRITGDEPFRNLGVARFGARPGRRHYPTHDFHVSRLQNTEGGPLKGIELNAQVQFRNLPGFWSNTGFLANYTHVESTIEYILTSAAGVPRDVHRGRPGRPLAEHGERHVVLRRWHVQRPHHGFVSRRVHPWPARPRRAATSVATRRTCSSTPRHRGT